MKLQFECGSTDATPVAIESDWFQITYSMIRNSDDEEIAHFNNGVWYYNGHIYSDIVASAC